MFLPPTVLLVDSHEDSRLIYAAALRHHGMGVLLSDCARSAVEVARRERPALIVIELSVSSSPGWEAVRSLRAAAETAATPLVGVSSTGLPEHRDRALRSGCAAFLVKPLPPLELIAQVRHLLEREAGRG